MEAGGSSGHQAITVQALFIHLNSYPVVTSTAFLPSADPEFWHLEGLASTDLVQDYVLRLVLKQNSAVGSSQLLHAENVTL